jgi:TonB family protein
VRASSAPFLLVAAATAIVACLGASDAQAQATDPAAPAPTTPTPTPAPAAAASLVAPSLLSDPVVPYPAGAKGDATVVVTVTVGEDGAVRTVVAAERNEPFSRLAEAAARKWRFEPATRGGKPVAARIRLEIVFTEPRPEPPPPEPVPIDGTAPAQAPTRPQEPAGPTEVRVRGARVEPSRTATLSRAEVRQIPGAFGDPFRAIEIMPGVTPIVSGLPFFFIRGAPPGNVGYFLDGIRVPYLFHVGVGPSVIHPALVERVDLYPGGYPARFGRFSGGIVSGETVAPLATDTHGEFNIRLFDAGALVEESFADKRGTVLIGGRYSYTAALLTALNSSTTLDYWDYQTRITYDVTPQDRISLFTFGASDFLGQKTATDTITLFGTEFYRLDLRYDHRIDADATVRTAVTGGLDRTRLDNGRFLRDRMLGTRTEISYRLSPAALVRIGADAQADRYDIELDTGQLSPAQLAVVGSFPSRTDLTVGTRGDVVIEAGPRLEITPGVRFDYYGSEGATAVAVDPRLATRATLTERVHLLAALGTAHQPPAFVIPVPGFQPGGLKGGLQNAVQESAGLELDLGNATTLTTTGFHNAFYDMSDALSVTQPTVSGCAPGTFPEGTLAGDPGTQPTGSRGQCGIARFPPGTIGPDRSGGGGQGAQNAGQTQQAAAFEARTRGQAYGLEVFLKRKLTSRVGGFLSYTLSRSTRSNNNQDFIASFDRTHVLNAALAFDLGRNWRAGTRVTFYTGLPKAADPTNPGATRLDPFFRLDLRIEKRWQLGRRKWVSFVAEWMNATLTKESIGTSCTLSGCQETKIGPVTIPSIGVEGGF